MDEQRNFMRFRTSVRFARCKTLISIYNLDQVEEAYELISNKNSTLDILTYPGTLDNEQ